MGISLDTQLEWPKTHLQLVQLRIEGSPNLDQSWDITMEVFSLAFYYTMYEPVFLN